MKYLFAGGVSAIKLKSLIALSSIRSDSIISGLESHLIVGHRIEAASALASVPPANLARAVDKLELIATEVEKIKDDDWGKRK